MRDRSRAIHPGLLALAVASGVPGALAPAETVHRRGGNDSITADRITMRSDGVHAVRASGAEYVVPWDMVKSIEQIDDPTVQEAWLRYQPMAEELWRARSRLQRGDARLAEPLFERHFEQAALDGGDSELALIVAEGLLRSRLSRGAIESALPAALETIRLRRAGVSTDRYQMLPVVVDERFWLVPALPPVITDRAKVAALGEMLAPWLESEDSYVRALASGYAALDGASGSVTEGGSGPGLALIGAALDATSPEADLRAEARETLQATVEAEDAPDWIDAWRRWYSARSMLMEQDPDIDIALIELLHIPAIHGGRSPALAARAVALAAETLEREKRFSEAALLRREQLVSQADVAPAIVLVDEQTPEPAGLPVEPTPVDENSEAETP